MNAETLAVLPFAICQRYGLAVGYERSFKLHRDRLLANRYLLGIPTSQLTIDRAHQIADHLAMPRSAAAAFWDRYRLANLLLIGYEDQEPGSVFKLYLEFDETVIPFDDDSPGAAKRLLHHGIKWQPGRDDYRISDYVWQTNYSRQSIEQAIASVLVASDCGGEVMQLVATALDRTDADQFRYVDVIETGRQSFDLNVYAARLRVGDVFDICHRMLMRRGVPLENISRLRSIVADRPLGHIAAGSDGSGQAFVTLYFEP